jgi:cytochrome c oxidase assembly protein subunit 15
MATSLPRVRAFAVSAGAFRGIALANAIMLLVIVSSGATVRLTASGLGCPKWPGCEGATKLPARDHYQQIEFTNRLVSGLTILLTLATWLAAVWTPSVPKWTQRLALATFLGALAQAPLGAITVYFDLNPWLVLSHFLLSIAILTLALIVALEAWNARGDPQPLRLRQLALLVGASCAALIVSGTLATAAGRFPGSFDDKPIQRLGEFYPAMWLHVRATAIFGISFAVIVCWLAYRRSRAVLLALLVFAVLATQMAVGEIQYRIDMLWWIVLIHVTLAALLWAATVVFVAMVWRPRGGSRMAR